VALPKELTPWWGPILQERLTLRDYPVATEAQVVVRDSDGVRCGPHQIGTLWASANSGPDTAIDSKSEREGDTELLGFADEQGQFFSLGRRANALRTAFGWLAPTECEVLLESHRAVTAAALVAVERDKALALGYELDAEAGFFAVVVLNPEVSRGTPLVEIELLDFCAQKLSAAKCPFGLVFSDSLPRALGGDIDLEALYSSVVAAHQAS